jgi:hypothetical protein
VSIILLRNSSLYSSNISFLLQPYTDVHPTHDARCLRGLPIRQLDTAALAIPQESSRGAMLLAIGSITQMSLDPTCALYLLLCDAGEIIIRL